MKIHTQEITTSLETKIAHHKNPEEGDILVSSPGVIETHALFVGVMSTEYTGGEWCVWQIMFRLTDYCASIEEANHLLEAINRKELSR